MRLNFVLFVLGAWLLQRQPDLPPLAAAWGVAVACIAHTAAARVVTQLRPASALLAGIAWCAVGFAWAATLAQARLADSLPAAWEGRDVELIGVVATLPQRLERGVRFELDVEDTLTPQARVPHRIGLAWWTGAGRELPPVRAGERWKLTVRLKRPHGMVNPHGYDYEAWLLERGIRATGYVRGRAAVRMSAMVHSPGYWVEAARGVLRDRILRAMEGREYGGVLAALAVGDQRAVPAEQWQVFTRTGVNHLMSISGLHITMVSGLAFLLCSRAWRRSARLTLALPARKAAVVAGLLAAYGYTLLAGFAVPAQRTLYMLVIVAAALWTGRFTSATRVLAAALFAVVLADPWAVLSPGFWLSFGAVAVILHATMHRVAMPGWWAGWARTQWAVTVGLAPLLLALFQQVSIVSPLANALAIPVVSLAVVPLVLVGMLLPFDALLHLAHALVAACLWVLEAMSALPAPVWQQHAPPAWTIVAALLGALWLLMPRGFPARPAGLAAMLPLYFVTPPAPPHGAAWVTVLDVGHGLAVAVRTAEHALLYDSGPAYGPGSDAGNRVVVPFLRGSGVARLDGMIVTHDDADHTGGALSVLQAMPVGWLMSSLNAADPLLFNADAGREWRCVAGLAWVWDGVRFEMLHPGEEAGGGVRFARDNDRSCVLRIATAGASMLLPADIELGAELDLLERDAAALRSDVLIAPHQGSRSSSSPEFLLAVAPGIAIFPAGYRNRFGHPHADVLERYRGLEASLYRTDQDGAVRVVLPVAGRILVERQREAARRYWYTQETRDEGHDAPEPPGTRLDQPQETGGARLDDDRPAFLE